MPRQIVDDIPSEGEPPVSEAVTPLLDAEALVSAARASGCPIAENHIRQLDGLPDLAMFTPVRGKDAFLKGWNEPGAELTALAALTHERCLKQGTGLGLLSGHVTGLLVVDLDTDPEHPSRGRETFLQITGRSFDDLPATPTTISGKVDREKRIYRVPESWRQPLKGYSFKKDESDLELRYGAGRRSGDFKAAMSVILGPHPESTAENPLFFRWREGSTPKDLPIAEAPEWLLEAMLEQLQLAPKNTQEPQSGELEVPLHEFIALKSRQLIEYGSQPGSNNDDGIKLALDLTGTERWLKSKGVRPEKSARDLYAAFVEKSAENWDRSKPFDHQSAWQRFEGAQQQEPTPSTPDEKLKQRLAFRYKISGRSYPDSCGNKKDREGEVKPRRIRPDEVTEEIIAQLGIPRFNLRTEEIVIRETAMSADDVSTLYLDLSTDQLVWPKELTFDAVTRLAKQHSFDPALEWLLATTEGVEPLPDDDWCRLDRLILDIDDPVAAAFLPRYLIGAVARLIVPGCKVDQTPVIVGPQGLYKGEAGRALFGKENFGEDASFSAFDVDEKTKANYFWCNELAEFDGITRKADTEKLKSFLTTTVDVVRKKYGRAHGRMPRRWVGWATSNGTPLHDPTGNRRFTCIGVSKKLPIERITQFRPSIWSRALSEYHLGTPWYSSDEEMLLINAQNEDFTVIDPWCEMLERVVDETSAKYLTTEDLAERLNIDRSRINNAQAARIKTIMEGLGWKHARRRIGNGKPTRAYFSPKAQGDWIAA